MRFFSGQTRSALRTKPIHGDRQDPADNAALFEGPFQIHTIQRLLGEVLAPAGHRLLHPSRTVAQSEEARPGSDG
jgi:hypothetical protein